MCEVLGSYAGILAPDHDGFFPAFATAGRAAFDEAEPMATQVVEMTQVTWIPDSGPRKPLSHARRGFL